MKNAVLILGLFSAGISVYADFAEVNIFGNAAEGYGANIMSAYRDFPSRQGVRINFMNENAAYDLKFQQDYNHNQYYLAPWGNLVFNGFSADQQNDARMYSDDPVLVNPPTQSYLGKDLTLKNVSLVMDNLRFTMGYGGDSTLRMDNATFDGNGFGVATDQTFTLESEGGGTNTIVTLQDVVAKSSTINVRPGSTLHFVASQRFESPTAVNVEDSELLIGGAATAVLRVDESGSLVSIDRGKLSLRTSYSELSGERLSAKDSVLSLANNTVLRMSGRSELSNTHIALNSGASLVMGAQMVFSGSNVLSAVSSSGTMLDLSGMRIENGSLYFDVANSTAENDLDEVTLNNGRLDLAVGSDIGANFNIENNSILKSRGNFIEGHAFVTSGSRIEGSVDFSDFVWFLGGGFTTLLRPNVTNDIISGVRNADTLGSDTSILELNDIRVEGDSAVATDYTNKTFVVATAPTITGVKSVSAGASLPALVAFDVSDEVGIGGYTNVTLTGKLLPTSVLAHHPGTSGSPNASQVVSILPSSTNAPANTQAQALQNAVLSMNNAQVGSHLNTLHAEPYSSYLTIGLELNDLMMNSVLDRAVPLRVEAARALADPVAEEADPRKSVWFDTGYVRGNVDGENGLGTFDYTLNSVLIGADLLRAPNVVQGVFAGYGRHRMDEHDALDQDFRTDSYHLGTYGRYGAGNWLFASVLGYAYGDNESKRNVSLGGTNGVSEASFNSQNLYVGLRAARPIRVAKKLVLSPHVGVTYSYLFQDEITESGFDMADLVVDSANADSLVTALGLSLAYEAAVSSMILRPVTFVKYEHDWSANQDSEHYVDAAFKHTPDSKTRFAGQNRGANMLSVGLGMDLEVTPRFNVGGSVRGGRDTNGREAGAELHLDYLF